MDSRIPIDRTVFRTIFRLWPRLVGACPAITPGEQRQAILILADVVDEILPFVITDQAIIDRARAANEAARRTVTE